MFEAIPLDCKKPIPDRTQKMDAPKLLLDQSENDNKNIFNQYCNGVFANIVFKYSEQFKLVKLNELHYEIKENIVY